MPVPLGKIRKWDTDHSSHKQETTMRRLNATEMKETMLYTAIIVLPLNTTKTLPNNFL